MNMSQVITRIKMDMGLNVVATPFENLNETIHQIICVKTLPVYSLYVPNRVDGVKIDLRNLVKIRNMPTEEEFILPKFNDELLYIYSIDYAQSDLTSALGAASADFPVLRGPGSIASYCQSNATLDIYRRMVPTMTFQFIKPNRIKLWNRWYQNFLSFDLGFKHSPSLATIPDSQQETFIELAELDVKITLYETMKMYTDLSTAYGHVNLRIDSWESAKSDRKDLLNNWDGFYHLDQDAFYYG